MALIDHNRRRALIGVLPQPDNRLDKADKGYIWRHLWPSDLLYIFDQVVANLKTISIANGFSFDIGERVYGWQVDPFEDSDLPAINVRDPLNFSDEAEEEFHRYEFKVCLYDSGAAAPASVREKAQDVLTAFKLIAALPQIEAVLFLGSTKAIARGAEFFSAVILRFAIVYHIDYFVTGEKIII